MKRINIETKLGRISYQYCNSTFHFCFSYAKEKLPISMSEVTPSSNSLKVEVIVVGKGVPRSQRRLDSKEPCLLYIMDNQMSCHHYVRR